MSHKSLVILIAAVIAFLSTMTSCRKSRGDDKLSIERTNYTGNQLKVNGYYYNKHGSPEKLTIYILYYNGVILHTGDSWELSKLNEFEQTIQSADFINKLKGIKYSWGAFKLESTNIKFERWYPSEAPYKAYYREGHVLNDSTFKITELYRIKRGKRKETESKDETYFYKHFSFKPDSTNSFVN